MRLALITTTVNVPTVLKTYVAHVPDDCTLDLVVAGDVQTPSEARDLVGELGGTYLGVDGDDVERWETHRAVGTHCVQRRNVALLHALTLGPDVIVTVDDDNEPHDPSTYFSEIVERLTAPPTWRLTSSTDWFDPGSLLDPPTVHRGLPLNRRHQAAVHTRRGGDEYGKRLRVGVVAGLTLGDPDVDALDRIVMRPTTTRLVDEVVLASGTWAPFNTQNTAYAWEVAPLMQCLVAVGRYDDIWMSYYARRVMDDLGWHVHYGAPPTVSVRNEHDLVTDLEREIHGYRYTPPLVDALRRVRSHRVSAASPLDCLEEAYDRTRSHHKYRTTLANQAWLRDAREAVNEGAQRRMNVSV